MVARKVVLYSRPGCHLCEDAHEVIEDVRRQDPDLPFDLEIRNITDEVALLAAYAHDIPVVTIDGVEAFRHRLTAPALRAALRAAGGAA